MSLPRYPEYRESGVNWLGHLPNHWTVCRYKQVFTERDERSSDGSEQLLSVSAYTGVTPRAEGLAEGEFLSRAESLEGYRICYPNDLVMNIMLAWNRGLGVSQHHGIVSPAYSVFRVRGGQDPRFLDYMVRSDRVILYYKAFSAGVIDSRLRLYPDTFSSLHCALPPPNEQRLIANFLDHETAKIDALIAEQKKLLALLAEKRQATISHAVTRGLDPHVPMKDSGIPWLGEVPAHWAVKPLKRVISNAKAGPFGSALTKDVYCTSGYRVYGQEQVIPGDFTRGDYFIDDEKYAELQQYAVMPGDILVSCVGTFGKVALVPEGIHPGVINPRLIRLRTKTDVSARFLVTVLRSGVVFEQFSLLSRGGTMGVINIGTLSDIQVAVPPLSEQEAICRFVVGECEKVDSLVSSAKHAIGLLEQRRTALIAAAVTGQIDVRGVVEVQAA